MKATELMVGDYIMFDGSPYIIEEISGKGWIHILHINNKSRVALSSDYILDFIEGIPLTEEMMQKNFPTPDFLKWWPVEENKNCFEVEIYVNSMLIEGFFEKVHELQHALKLCKWDKIVEL